MNITLIVIFLRAARQPAHKIECGPFATGKSVNCAEF